MATTLASITDLLAPDLHEVYFETGKDRPLEYPLVLNVQDMDWNPITDQQVSGLGTMPSKLEGVQFTKDEVILGGTKTYTANAYGLSVEITWEAWRDELYGVLQEMVRCLARAGRNREEVSAWSVFNNAFSTSYTGFTSSESLCSTAHTGLDNESRANRPSPDIGLSITGVQNAITRFEGMTDERNLPRVMSPVMCLTTPTNKFTAREIFGSGGKPYTSDNEINALVEDDMSYMIGHYITTSTYWWLLGSKESHDLRFFWRDRPIFDMFDEPRTKNAIATAYQRHTDGAFGSWRGVDGSTG
jgi:hypothetical protein